jgi:hypothetical protein
MRMDMVAEQVRVTTKSSVRVDATAMAFNGL